LNFVQGSISGQFDRQNIATAGTGNYTYGGATAGSPVTYSFNLSQNSGPDLNFHIYLYESIGDTASAPDYNQTNVLIFQVTPQTNGTTIASISWKTNLPSSGTISNAFFGSATSVTNPTIVGTWQLQFTSNTGGTVIAPGPVSYPFTINPAIAANLANPITVNFGINPQINDPKILGEYMVVSQISVTGTDPLSVNNPHTDNFLADSSLDTNTWTVNALTPASILFVPANTPYSVNWTVPDAGFGLQQNTNLTSSSSWADVSLPSVTLFPGKRTLIAQTNLPAGQAAFYHLLQRTYSQLQVLLPGETNAPNTITGKTGTPTPVSLGAGGNEDVTVNAVDSTFHILNGVTASILLSTTDTGPNGAALPGVASLINGTVLITPGVGFADQGSWTISATDTTNTNIPPATSSSVTVGP
jgi:hypothetical protein